MVLPIWITNSGYEYSVIQSHSTGVLRIKDIAPDEYVSKTGAAGIALG